MPALLILVNSRGKTECIQKLALETAEEDFRTPNASRNYQSLLLKPIPNSNQNFRIALPYTFK